MHFLKTLPKLQKGQNLAIAFPPSSSSCYTTSSHQPNQKISLMHIHILGLFFQKTANKPIEQAHHCKNSLSTPKSKFSKIIFSPSPLQTIHSNTFHITSRSYCRQKITSVIIKLSYPNLTFSHLQLELARTVEEVLRQTLNGITFLEHQRS